VENIYKEILHAHDNNRKAAICTVVSARGSTPRKAGAKMLIYENGEVSGSIGGGNLEKKVIENGLEQLASNESKLFKHDLLHQHSMCCGGSMDIFIEPIVKNKRLYVFGAGHTGMALVKFTSLLPFEVFLIDDRKEYLDRLEIKGVSKMHGQYGEILPSLPFNEDTFVVILTYEHALDRDILSHCIKQPFAYMGMIGSQRKIEMTKKIFIDGGIATEEEMRKVDMPMGLDIKANTPEEIAVSIAAKLIEVKNKSRK
jgi:xanthine dehydrogenase accessory factor